MLRLSLVFLLIAIVAGALGLWRAEFIAAEIAWALFVIFLVLAIASMILGSRVAPPT